MTPSRLPPQDDVRAAYRQGDEAVVALVETLTVTIRALEARIQMVEEQRAKDRHNSSKPPSRDGLKRAVKQGVRRPSGKKSGRQAGHVGHRLEKVAHPKDVKGHPVNQCGQCQASLEDGKGDAYEKR